MTEITTEAAPDQEAPSLWEDFIDIFYAPREVFARRKNGKFGLVLAILTVVITLLFFASQGPLADAYAAEFQRGMARGGNAAPQMTPEQAAQARNMGVIFGTLGLLIAMPIGVFLIGLTLWLAGKLVDSVATLGMAVLIITYAMFPRVLQMIVTLLEGLLLEPESLAGISVGPALFFDPDTASPVLMALLMRADVFYLWSTILIAIGAQVIGRVGRVQSYALAVAVWVVGAIPTVLPALLV